MAKAKKKNWIKSAIKHPGALRAKAKRAGGITKNGTIKASYMRKAMHSGDPTTRRQAALAMALRHMH